MRRMSKQRRIHVQLSGHERAARGHAKMSGSALLYCSTQAVRARQCAARQSSGKYMYSCPGASGRRGVMRKRAAPRLYIAAHKRCVPGNASHVKQRQIHVQLSRRERAARGHAQMSGSALLYCGAKTVRARECVARQSSGKYMCSCPGTSGRRGAMRKRTAPRFYIAVSKQRVPGNASHVKAEMR